MIIFLVVWWFALLDPLLFLLRGSADFLGNLVLGGVTISQTDSGDWTFRVPAEVLAHDAARNSEPVQLHAIVFDVPRSDVITFTFSLPVFWAIMLACPGIRRLTRPLCAGTLVIVFLETVLLLIFVEISALKVKSQLTQSHQPIVMWFARFGEYLLTLVIPYVAPVITALALNRDLRTQVFELTGESISS